MNNILEESKKIQPKLQEIRRDLHQHPEIAFNIPYTKSLVLKKLKEMGYQPKEVGKAGIIVDVKGPKEGKCILLRADMDALPIEEEADIIYKSKNNNAFHGCGHDMHTAMLLGCAEILKNHINEIEGTIRLEFQPAEEIFQGSLDMIDNGILEDPPVDAAVMIHVIAGVPIDSGNILICDGGISTASCEQYHITVTGKGGHGSMPQNTIDPITCAALIHVALGDIKFKRMDPYDFGVFSTGKFIAGNASNVIPEKAEMWGTIRTTDPTEKVGNEIKESITQISKGIGTAMRCQIDVEYYDYCPCMLINDDLAKQAKKYLNELDKEKIMNLSVLSGGKPGSGSEDFAFVSHKVPTASFFLVAGDSREGYTHSAHNSKVVFDDEILYYGCAAYVQMALEWLKNNK